MTKAAAAFATAPRRPRPMTWNQAVQKLRGALLIGDARAILARDTVEIVAELVDMLHKDPSGAVRLWEAMTRSMDLDTAQYLIDELKQPGSIVFKAVHATRTRGAGE